MAGWGLIPRLIPPSHVGVYVDLMTDGPEHGGRNDKGNHAYGDVLKQIENLISSNNMRPKRGDTLLGDDGPNRIDGRAGYDVIDGRGGDDVLIGGRHRDILTGGEGRIFSFWMWRPRQRLCNWLI